MKFRVVGNYTDPRSWGVYKVEHPRGAPSFHFGNHPVRQFELEREFGNATLVEVHLNRDAARRQKAALQTR